MHLEFISQDLGLWAYILLSIIVFFEGPVATLAGAVAASSGLMKPEWVFISAASGNLLADSLWYLLGYIGKIEWLGRFGRWFGFPKTALLRFTNDIENHAAKLLFIAKLTLGFTIPALVATGLARVHYKRWAPWLLIGELLWTGSLVFLGYHFGRYVQKLERGVEVIALAGAFFSVAFLVFYLGKIRQKNNFVKPDANFPH